jgi:hypothetical protein
MSALGQTEKNSVRAHVFRFALELGHCSFRFALELGHCSMQSALGVLCQPATQGVAVYLATAVPTSFQKVMPGR